MTLKAVHSSALGIWRSQHLPYHNFQATALSSWKCIKIKFCFESPEIKSTVQVHNHFEIWWLKNMTSVSAESANVPTESSAFSSCHHCIRKHTCHSESETIFSKKWMIIMSVCSLNRIPSNTTRTMEGKSMRETLEFSNSWKYQRKTISVFRCPRETQVRAPIGTWQVLGINQGCNVLEEIGLS